MNMKVRCIDPGKHSALLKGEIYDGELINNDIIEEKRWKIKGHEHMSYFESRFEIVKDNKMEKTFREVIADIKEGEVWESENTLTQIYTRNDVLIIDFKEEVTTEIVKIPADAKFRLKRKEYSFDEAFKAYEEGKEIESCNFRYKKIEGKDSYYDQIIDNWENRYDVDFSLEEIRNKWYIND